MCLIAFAWDAHPDYALVVVANRDEYHARPTAPLAPWTDTPQVLGGRDLKEGGGWLALRRERPKLVAVTNVREPLPTTPKRSRGALVRDFITEQGCAASFAERHRIDGDHYAGFNLLLWDGEELIYETNRPTPHWESVTAGVYGISNGTFDPPWPKTQRLTRRLKTLLTEMPRDTAPALEPLFAALADEQQAPDAEVPQTWVGFERERQLSSAFIRLPGYGTRASSVILIGRDGKGLFAERSFDGEGALAGEHSETFVFR